MTQVRTGSYDLAEDLKLRIQTSDGGTVIAVICRRSNRTLWATIDKCGQITIGRPQQKTASSAFTYGLLDPETLDTPDEEVLPPSILWKPKKGQKRITFTLQWGPYYWPRNRPYAIGGFTNGDETHVLYVVRSGSTASSEGQLLLAKDGRATERGILSEEMMSKESRAWFLTLDDAAEFGLGPRDWRKMTYDELRVMLEEKTIKLSR